MEQVDVALSDSGTADVLFDDICALYDDVFSEPPFHWEPEESEQHRARLRRIIADPSSGFALARQEGVLAGFVYGYTLKVDTKWWDGFQEPVPASVMTEHEGRTFAVIDLAVRPSHRGRKLGRRLLDTLLTSRCEERATLAVQPEPLATHHFYVHLGWDLVGRLEGAPGDSSPLFDIYVLPLR